MDNSILLGFDRKTR